MFLHGTPCLPQTVSRILQTVIGKASKNLVKQCKISISVAANGYVPMSARRGRTPGSAGFQYETLESVVKTKVSAFALA